MREYKSIAKVSGPLVILDNVKDVAYAELVKVKLASGEERTGCELDVRTKSEQEERTGQVLEVDESRAVVQMFQGTEGINVNETTVAFTGETMKFGLSGELIGRIFDGAGNPIDGGPAIVAEKTLDVNGSAINPVRRKHPENFIQTGVSTIDLMNTLVRGQKLPIFSGSGLPHNKLAAQIAKQAKISGKFAVVFAAMGITNEEALFFRQEFEKTGTIANSVMFLNLADDPAIERIITPRLALTTAEYLAYEKDMHVLVILTDMKNYCEALREISAARNEVPGRRGYPGYMYTDLASIYERAGMIHGKSGSVTQLPIVVMPDDDITHPIPDLTGYITEGQLVLSRDLHRKGSYPPIDVLPSLSRLMNNGIGKDKTREDHSGVSNQLYAAYAQGRELRDLVAVVGEEALGELDKKYLEFADAFELRFVKQGYDENRPIKETLSLAWELLAMLPVSELKRVDKKHIDNYHPSRKMRDKESKLPEFSLKDYASGAMPMPSADIEPHIGKPKKRL